jgi:hypothetical protein
VVRGGPTAGREPVPPRREVRSAGNDAPRVFRDENGTEGRALAAAGVGWGGTGIDRQMRARRRQGAPNSRSPRNTAPTSLRVFQRPGCAFPSKGRAMRPSEDMAKAPWSCRPEHSSKASPNRHTLQPAGPAGGCSSLRARKILQCRSLQDVIAVSLPDLRVSLQALQWPAMGHGPWPLQSCNPSTAPRIVQSCNARAWRRGMRPDQ